MLSRVADALYWMSRYIERAEHAARVLEVTRSVQLDLNEVEPAVAAEQWSGMLGALGVTRAGADSSTIAFDESEPASLVSSISRARENARQVREVISSEMWEHLNEAYWALKEASDTPDREEELSETLADLVTSSFLWGGVTDGTMRRGEGWLFIKLGQFVERAERVSRLVSWRSRAMKGGHDAESGDNVNLVSLLRSCSALEAYRKVHPARVDPTRVLAFLILDREFPRTIRYSIAVANDFARRLSPDRQRGWRVERAFGQLAARLEYSDVSEVLAQGTEHYLARVLGDLAEASLAVQHTYFLH